MISHPNWGKIAKIYTPEMVPSNRYLNIRLWRQNSKLYYYLFCSFVRWFVAFFIFQIIGDDPRFYFNLTFLWNETRHDHIWFRRFFMTRTLNKSSRSKPWFWFHWTLNESTVVTWQFRYNRIKWLEKCFSTCVPYISSTCAANLFCG